MISDLLWAWALLLSIVITIAQQVQGFQPPALSSVRWVPPSQRRGGSLVLPFSTAASLSDAPPLQPVDEPSRRQNKKKQNYDWLTWFHHQWTSFSSDASNAGTMEASMLNKVLPAMDMYAQTKTLQAAKRAEALLNVFVQEYQAGNKHAQMNISIFNAAINAYAQLGRPEEAQRIMRQMKQLSVQQPELLGKIQPDVITFSSLAHAWAQSGRPVAVTKIEAILDYTNEKEELGTSMFVYQYLMDAYSRSRKRDAYLKANGLLGMLNQMSLSGERPDLAPNTNCYAAVLRSLAYSKDPHKAERAYKLLSELRHRHETLNLPHCQPNVVVFTSAMNVCARPERYSLPKQRLESYAACQLIYQELRACPEYGKPNFLTYASYLQAITTLEPGEFRDQETKQIFQECCQAGQVGQIVLKKLKRAASQKLFTELVGNKDDLRHLPRSWSKNVRGERKS